MPDEFYNGSHNLFLSKLLNHQLFNEMELSALIFQIKKCSFVEKDCPRIEELIHPHASEDCGKWSKNQHLLSKMPDTEALVMWFH